MLPSARGAGSESLALGWLVLATAAVAASSLFAILIVFARVPGLGALFPGTEFYRVALTLHVNLSQWVWFMAFAGVLWSLGLVRTPGRWHWFALALAAVGALLMALSPALGAIRPLMANYLPVLDSPWFFAGLGAYGVAVLLMVARVVHGGAENHRGSSADSLSGVMRLGLRLAAGVVLAALLVFAVTMMLLPAELSGLAWFEALFWGAGHIWQFSLTTLMLLAWLGLTSARIPLPSATGLKRLLAIGAAPGLIAPLLLVLDPASPAYFGAFTSLMQWTSWQLPLVCAGWMLLAHWRAGTAPATGFSLSLILLVAGIALGAMIDGQTTLVTAHYHGTIGAVTLAFMGLTYGILGCLGCGSPSRRAAEWQLRLYGNGILLMMFGLAGAGVMGAPRKMAGNVGVGFGVETLSRIVMGLGGTLATIGILYFLVLVLRQLWPAVSLRMVRHG
ncbi:MAG: cbb3-type cytochrome c oxidase subunit I [Rhodocyclales bacterium]|nr:cbb3-type cytochrome c oxidase subunit I [Rhodocyclales bacterium]